MKELVCLIVGLMLGGCISTTLLCCLQIKRISYYEREIQRLRKKLNNNL